MNVLERRQRLCAAGYVPIPLFGKEPPIYGKNNKRKGFDGWQQTSDVTLAMLRMWEKTWPDAINTGILTRLIPTLDLDILNEDAARALEDAVRERYEERGPVLVRIGKPPKRAIPFRTDEPFDKFVVNLIAPNASEEKIEFFADGAQIAVFGIHPDTNKPYTWFGGEPGEIKREELPYIREDEARELVDALVEILVRDFGYARAKERPKRARKTNGKKYDFNDDVRGADDWKYLIDNIAAGRELHDSLRDLACKLIKSGMKAGAAVNYLRAQMEASTAPHDDRWRERLNDIPRLVESAVDLLKAPAQPAADVAPSTIDKTFAAFERWLILKDKTPVLAVLGAVAANYLPGDPVWLGVIAPPSSAKTEILNSLSSLPNVVHAATLTPAGLLSGTPKKQTTQGARGGLLRQLGNFGIVVIKDFGSILSMHTETRAEVMAALRELYDGAWTRHLGSDGGKTLSWTGKLAVIFAATEVIDSHYAVIGAMGDRFLMSRLAPVKGQKQFTRALDHLGASTKQMREELARAVAALFAGRKSDPKPISKQEAKQIGNTISLVVKLRGAVARDWRSKEIEAIYGAEGTARIGLALERLLAGLDTLGVDRKKALDVVKSVALDSVPPLRRRAYECVYKYTDPKRQDGGGPLETANVAIELGLPTNTTRRILEELAAHGLIVRCSQGPGKADTWNRADWEAEE
jgi:hypothetical protein